MRLRLILGFLLLVSLSASAIQVIPVPASGSEGDTWSQVPFSGVTLTEVPPMRFQQVYDASAFSTLSGQSGLISGLWFVSDDQVGRGDWGASLPKVEITMTLTAGNPDGLSSTFADNYGAAPRVVHPLGPLLIQSGGRGSAVYIGFQSPFLYDPGAGNLLLEIKNWEPTQFPGVPQANAGPLDAWNVTGDPISRVYAIGDANATTGTADTLGLTTYFVVTAVPEPSSIVLLALGLAGFGVHWSRNKRQRNRR